MAKKPKTKIEDDVLPETGEIDEESLETEADDVEETQELSFEDESYNRLGDITYFDEWN